MSTLRKRLAILIKSCLLAVCCATASTANENPPDLKAWSDINTAMKCAAFGKLAKQPGYEAFEKAGLEQLRSFFASADGDPLKAFPFESYHLKRVDLDESVDFKAGVAFSVLYRQALEAIEIQTHPTVIPDYPSVEQQEAARDFYANTECEALLK